MIKFIMCVRRNPKLSQAEFLDYWLNHHGPLFQQHAASYKALRYVQNHRLETALNANLQQSRGMQEAYDGVGEIWWESEADFLAALSSPEGQRLRQVFIEDEARFVDLARSCAFFSNEHVLLDERSN